MQTIIFLRLAVSLHLQPDAHAQHFCVCVCVCVTTAQGDTRLAPKTIHEKDDCSKPVSLQFLAGNNNTNNTNNNNKYHQELLAGPGCLAFPADLPCPGHPEVRGSQGSQEDRARVRRL